MFILSLHKCTIVCNINFVSLFQNVLVSYGGLQSMLARGYILIRKNQTLFSLPTRMYKRMGEKLAQGWFVLACKTLYSPSHPTKCARVEQICHSDKHTTDPWVTYQYGSCNPHHLPSRGGGGSGAKH